MKRTQYRAECSVCGRDHAVKGKFMVDHGYNIKFHWRAGSCFGQNREHFGTPEGRDLRASIVVSLRENAVKHDERAARVESGAEIGRKLDRDTKQMRDMDERETRGFIYTLRSHASEMRREADRLEATVQAWVAAEPRAVEVDNAIKIHMVGGYGVMCAGSVMGAQRKQHRTSDIAHVTCPACLRAIERRKEYLAKRAAEKAAQGV